MKNLFLSEQSSSLNCNRFSRSTPRSIVRSLRYWNQPEMHVVIDWVSSGKLFLTISGREANYRVANQPVFVWRANQIEMKVFLCFNNTDNIVSLFYGTKLIVDGSFVWKWKFKCISRKYGGVYLASFLGLFSSLYTHPLKSTYFP